MPIPGMYVALQISCSFIFNELLKDKQRLLCNIIESVASFKCYSSIYKCSTALLFSFSHSMKILNKEEAAAICGYSEFMVDAPEKSKGDD